MKRFKVKNYVYISTYKTCSIHLKPGHIWEGVLDLAGNYSVSRDCVEMTVAKTDWERWTEVIEEGD